MKILSVGEEKAIGESGVRLVFASRKIHVFSVNYPGTAISMYNQEMRLFFEKAYPYLDEALVPLLGFTCFAEKALKRISANTKNGLPIYLIAPVIKIGHTFVNDVCDYDDEGLLRLDHWSSDHPGHFVLSCVKTKEDEKNLFATIITKEDLEEMLRQAKEAKKHLGKDCE